MTDDIWDDAEAKAWLDHAKNDLRPKIAESAATMTLWSGSVDPKIAVELGYSILMDKPIIIMAEPGTSIPDTLAKVATRVVRTSFAAPALADAVSKTLTDMGLGDSPLE